jgi:hypothetical protein
MATRRWPKSQYKARPHSLFCTNCLRPRCTFDGVALFWKVGACHPYGGRQLFRAFDEASEGPDCGAAWGSGAARGGWHAWGGESGVCASGRAVAGRAQGHLWQSCRASAWGARDFSEGVRRCNFFRCAAPSDGARPSFFGQCPPRSRADYVILPTRRDRRESYEPCSESSFKLCK